LADPLIVASLLTRLPVPVDHARAGARMAQALWAAPLVGAALGAITGATLVLGLWVGLAPLAAGVVAVAVSLRLTGALHEDGLADCADGFGGGHTVARRLEIMRDSRLGTYGVAALTLALVLRVSLLADLDPALALGACVLAGAVSRVPIVWALSLLPSARPGGLAAGVGVPPPWAPWLATAVAVGLAVATEAGPTALVAALLAAGVVGQLARRAIGGQTGDVLGAMQVTGELAALAVLATMRP
jgi:adenosylcobinamide-GDP ribazoletransferase